ncbi:Uncharacterized protein GBIM_08862 [Gryllus bimaculatus]|nr:Uncharacterized protein GBIM_08862 [Gryllus bimaculatus]
MSGKKRSSGKITLGMLKGKSITTSVPSFAIRFHTGGEELDEIYPSAEDTDDDAEKPTINIGFLQKEDTNTKNEIIVEQNSGNPPSASGNVSSAMPSSSSSSLAAGTPSISVASAPSRDPSPMKEYFKGIGKRSTSMDAGIIDGASGSDAGWRIFHEWKGKITKTVEERFSEKFSDKKPASASSSEPVRRGRLGSGSGSGSKSKENSSVSDDEGSESLNQQSDTKISEETKIAVDDKQPSLKSESSPKRSVEEKKSLSLEEKDDVLSDSLTDPPSTSSAVDVSDLTDISSKGLIKKSGFRNRMKHNLTGLRSRHRAASAPITGRITMSSLSASAEDDVELQTDSDIEPAVEASEDIKFNVFQKTHQIEEDAQITTTDYRTTVPTSHPPLEKPKKRFKNYFGLVSRLWSSKFVVLGLSLCLYSVFYEVPASFIGFFWGALVVYIYYAVRDMVRALVMPRTESQSDFHLTSMTRDVSSSDLPILEVPAAKEYQPLTKYEGWMNEYPDSYNPDTYSITATQTVYVRLEGSTLRVSNTRLKIPKRAMWNERRHKLRFTHQRIYNIANCAIKLLPEGLTRRRLWSKKYPICIVLLKSSALKSCLMNIVKEASSLDETSQRTGVALDSEGLDLLSQGSDTIPDSRSDFDENSLFDSKSGENKSFDEEEMSIPGDISDEDTFCHIDKSALEETCLYLFARTDREKEDWYRRLAAAVKFHTPMEEEVEEQTQQPTECPPEVAKSVGLLPKITTNPPNSTLPDNQDSVQSQQKPIENTEDTIYSETLEDANSDYLKFMSVYKLQVLTAKGKRILKPAPLLNPPAHSPHRNSKQKLDAEIQNAAESDVAPNLMWFNAFIGRVLYDLMKNPFWVLKLQERIQKKLSAIRLPHFVGEIIVSELDVGESVPLIHCTSSPMLDERGLWVNVDITYKGNASLTLETKLNLLKLKKEQPSDTSSAPSPSLASPSTPVNTDKRSSPMFDSDLDDSAESSDDDSDFDKSSTDEEYVGSSAQNAGSTGKRILRMVNKIAASKYFQQATDYKYIKRAMEEVSNTRIILSVEVKGLAGTLTLNLPPPPSDRLWYGFRGCPHLALSARPKFGERQVNISHVVSWIEKQLVKEFQKKMVLPNMDDIVIGPMKDALPK